MDVKGPVCFFRLTNRTNNKDIYLFGDIHKQTNDDTITGIDIDDFIYQFLNNYNKSVIDVMLEDNHVDDRDKFDDHNIYFSKINKMFYDMYIKKPSYEYLRIHYVDVRNEKKDAEVYLNDILTNHITYNNLNKVQKILTHTLNMIKNKDGMYEKLLNNYNNRDVKKYITEQFNINCYRKTKYAMNKLQIVKNKWLELNKSKTIFVDNDEEHKKYFISKSAMKKIIRYDVEIIREHVQLVNMFYMDYYFLRRFLDKSYVTKCIVYVGLMHVLHYLYVLVNIFDYDIVEMSFLDYDIVRMNNVVKNMKSVYGINELIDGNMLRFEQHIRINKLFGHEIVGHHKTH